MLGDINIAEPQALIGFAGPRVIQQTVRETLPPGFQRSEFLLEHGALDMIVDRRELRDRIASLLALLLKRDPPMQSDVEAVEQPDPTPESDSEPDVDAESEDAAPETEEAAT